MIEKIKLWWGRRKHTTPPIGSNGYTLEQLKNAYNLGYNDGKRDGLAIAREQATKSLSEILKKQNER